MPGRRNFARERAEHAAAAPERQALVNALLAAYPDKALIGPTAILRFLHRTLELRRLNGEMLTWRIVSRWRRDHAAPILRGNRTRGYRSPAFTTEHALTSWLLTRFHSAEHFTVGDRSRLVTTGQLPTTSRSQQRNDAADLHD